MQQRVRIIVTEIANHGFERSEPGQEHEHARDTLRTLLGSVKIPLLSQTEKLLIENNWEQRKEFKLFVRFNTRVYRATLDKELCLPEFRGKWRYIHRGDQLSGMLKHALEVAFPFQGGDTRPRSKLVPVPVPVPVPKLKPKPKPGLETRLKPRLKPEHELKPNPNHNLEPEPKPEPEPELDPDSESDLVSVSVSVAVPAPESKLNHDQTKRVRRETNKSGTESDLVFNSAISLISPISPISSISPASESTSGMTDHVSRLKNRLAQMQSEYLSFVLDVDKLLQATVPLDPRSSSNSGKRTDSCTCMCTCTIPESYEAIFQKIMEDFHSQHVYDSEMLLPDKDGFAI